MICSMCGGEIVEDEMTRNLKCTKCGRGKTASPQDRQAVHEIDMNEDTKDLDVLME